MAAIVIARKGPPTYGGIDPGRKGFLVLVDAKGKIVRADPIPYLGKEVNHVRLLAIFREWKLAGCVLAFLEHQQPFGVEGVVSIWTAAEAYGALKTALASAGIPFELPTPNVWKKDAGIPEGGAKNLPKFPIRPGKGNKLALARWKAQHAEISAKRKKLSADHKKRKKLLAVARAQALAPHHDFRASARAQKDSDGYAESYLLAHLARRRHVRSGA